MTEEPQHMQALALANHKRIARAAIKRDIRAGRASVIEIIRNSPPELDKMTLCEVLRCQHRWGNVRAIRFLNELAISERRPLGQLTDRQKLVLSDALRQKGVA